MATIQHTYHPNTFGLLYGKTTKTACGKRVITNTLVKPMETTCPGCQEAMIAEMHTQHEMHQAATELVKAEGYSSVSEWAVDHKPEIRDMLTPRSWKRRGLV